MLDQNVKLYKKFIVPPPNFSVSFRDTSRLAQGQPSWSFVIRSAFLERRWHRIYEIQFQTWVIS